MLCSCRGSYRHVLVEDRGARLVGRMLQRHSPTAPPSSPVGCHPQVDLDATGTAAGSRVVKFQYNATTCSPQHKPTRERHRSVKTEAVCMTLMILGSLDLRIEKSGQSLHLRSPLPPESRLGPQSLRLPFEGPSSMTCIRHSSSLPRPVRRLLTIAFARWPSTGGISCVGPRGALLDHGVITSEYRTHPKHQADHTQRCSPSRH
jgi:hypothetical protein